MAYCPKCREEYEEDIKICGDCNVELVASLEDIHNERMLLVVNTEEEVKKVIDFLEYSKVMSGMAKEAHNEHGEHVYVIYIDEDDWKNATRVMQGYVMTEKEEPNTEDYYFDEYETIDLEAESDLSEIKSSYMAFLGIGGAVAVIGLLNMLNVLDILPGNMPIIFTVLGILFVFIGIYTKSSMSLKAEIGINNKDEFERLYQLYIDKYALHGFTKRHKINLEELDEGAKYFALMDLIVKECEKMNLSEDDKMINTIAEKVYNSLEI